MSLTSLPLFQVRELSMCLPCVNKGQCTKLTVLVCQSVEIGLAPLLKE